MDYVPTVKQALFHRSTCTETLYGGAAGGGKSHASVMDALGFCLQHPGVHAYMFRRTYPELEDSLIRTAQGAIPEGLGRYVAGRHDWEFPNGSAIHFRHCKGTEDTRKYQGAEIHRLYIDELTHWPLGMYAFIRSRLRSVKKLGITPLTKCTTNPGGIGHTWVKKRFVDAGPPLQVQSSMVRSEAAGGREQLVTRLYIPALATENPHINDEYIFELEQKPPQLRDALLYGKWDAFEGQVFDEFTDNPDGYDSGCRTHVVTPFRIPESWPRYRAMDWGYAKPFAVLWAAVSPQDVLYIYREWYGCEENAPNVGVKLTATEVARGIRRTEEEFEHGRHIRGIADPHIFDTQTGDSVGDIMAREGVYFDKANNARLLGWAQLHDRLRFDEAGMSHLYFFSNCHSCIRTIPALPYSKGRGKSEDVDTESEDHLADALRYLLMDRPLGRKPMAARKQKPFNPLE